MDNQSYQCGVTLTLEMIGGKWKGGDPLAPFKQNPTIQSAPKTHPESHAKDAYTTIA